QARGVDRRTGEKAVTQRHSRTETAAHAEIAKRRVLRVLCVVCGCLLLIAAATLSAQQAPDRSHPPQAGPPAPLRLPAIQKQRLSNGLPVWIVETHEVPVAQINLVVHSGTANDPPGKFGVASLAAAMLEEGAGGRSALEIADAVDYLGADLGATSGIDSSAVRLHVPVTRLG